MLIKKFNFSLKTNRREQFIPISEEVNSFVQKVGENIIGTCKIFIPHTSAAIIVNQNVNPDVMRDFQNYLNSDINIAQNKIDTQKDNFKDGKK